MAERWLERTPALDRLEWLLSGLNGAEGWGADLQQVISADFLEAIAPVDYRALTRERSASFAPVRVSAIELNEHGARARLRNRDGHRFVLSCQVEPVSPYLIKGTSLQAEVPADLTPRLPADFTGWQFPAAAGNRLIAFAGVPGSGKSTLADTLGRQLGIPVFAMDWTLGALTPFGGRHFDHALDLGYEQLLTSAVRQLQLGQSAILDGPLEDGALRRRLASLARAAGVALNPIVVSCGDPEVHRTRLASRERGIPGWHQGGDWADVQRRLRAFEPWPGALAVDSSQPLPEILATVLTRLT